MQCAAGFGHVAALTNQGVLFTWGFNVYGQLGQGDYETRYTPEMVQYAASGDQLHPIIKVKCSQYATYMIDSNGRPYSWGKGYIGMGDKVTKVNMP